MTCPQCGAPMTSNPAPEPRALARAMIDHGSQHAYAQNFTDRVHEKEAEHGVVHTCVDARCAYVTRVRR